MLYRIYSWNFVLTASLIGWFAAQIIKTFIYSYLNGGFDLSRMWGDGGMPSAHSATVCAMVAAIARTQGMHTAIFGLACIFAFITMHDAMGVRRETGEQAKVLNNMIAQWDDIATGNSPFMDQKQLKEMVGHTPLQVVCGGALGALVGVLLPL